MNRFVFGYIFCQLLLFALPAKGQPQTALDRTIEECYEIEKEVRWLKEQQKVFSENISTLKLQVDSLRLLKVSLSEQVDSIENATSKNVMSAMQNKVDSLQRRKDELRDAVNALKKELWDKQSTLSSLTSEMEQMNEYKEMKQREDYAQNKEYLNMRYSEMSLDVLNAINANKRQFSGEKDYKDYEKRLSETLRNKQLYDSADRAIRKKSTPKEIDTLRDGLFELLNLEKDDTSKGVYKLTPNQYSELDTLDIKLSRYNGGVKALQKIVSDVNNDSTIQELRKNHNNSSKAKCVGLMKMFILPTKGTPSEEVHERYFKMIPYLDKLLKTYWKELQKNPFAPTKTEKIINELETT